MSARLAAVRQACDDAWLHLLEKGLVSARPDDLVTATLRTVLREAEEAEVLQRRPRRRWTA